MKIEKKVKVKKVKKVKKEKYSSDYNRLVKILANILNVSQGSTSMWAMVYSDSRPLEEQIISKIISLKEDFAREDEGTKLEAENKRNLMEVIGMLTGDEKRLIEAGKKIEQSKKEESDCCED